MTTKEQDKMIADVELFSFKVCNSLFAALMGGLAKLPKTWYIKESRYECKNRMLFKLISFETGKYLDLEVIYDNSMQSTIYVNTKDIDTLTFKDWSLSLIWCFDFMNQHD